MASLVLGIAGAAALGPAGLAWGGALGMSGAQIGFMAGSTLGSMLTKMPDIQGPRLADLKVQASTYGTMIPIYYGTARGAGQVIWSSDLIETEHEESGGKGGGPSYSTYTYSVNCAVAICEGEILGVRRILANGDLIMDASDTNTGITGQSSNIRTYTGSETQVADSLLEAYLGTGNVPAHRGLAYVVFENLQLEKYGNRIPNFTFEAVCDGDITYPTYMQVTDTSVEASMNHPFIDGILLSLSADNGSTEPVVLHISDMISMTDRTMDLGEVPASYCKYGMEYIDIYDPVMGVVVNEIWISYDNLYDNVIAIALDAATLAFTRYIQVTPAGFNDVGNMHFDKTNSLVLFASDSSSIFAYCRYLDVMSLTWEGPRFGTVLNDFWSGSGITGHHSIALSNIFSTIGIFARGMFVKEIGTSNGQPYMAYDTLRERYAWFDREYLNTMVFKTIDDEPNGLFPVTEFITSTPFPDGGFYSLDYFPIADKYFYCNRYSVHQLNAETFNVEGSWPIVTHPSANIHAREIAGVPEYIGLNIIDSASTGIHRVPITNRISANPVPLSEIVSDICERVTLTSGDIDVTQLTDDVNGYMIGQQIQARAAIDGLQAAFYFDAVESD